MLRGSGSWSYDAKAGAWYFKLKERTDLPIRSSIFAEARIDIDDDGRVAGIELLDPRLLPPKAHEEAKEVLNMDFSEWIRFEAGRIISMGLVVSEEHRAGYMRVNIEAALRKAFAHGRDGFTETDPPRAVP
jgi:uncharacterized protein YuzE